MGWVGALSAIAGLIRAETVSIPERVWGGLEQAGRSIRQRGSDVSIPERVWGGLELSVFDVIVA